MWKKNKLNVLTALVGTSLFSSFFAPAFAELSTAPAICTALLGSADDSPVQRIIQTYLSLIAILPTSEVQKLAVDPLMTPTWPDGSSENNQGKALRSIVVDYLQQMTDQDQSSLLKDLKLALQQKLRTLTPDQAKERTAEQQAFRSITLPSLSSQIQLAEIINDGSQFVVVETMGFQVWDRKSLRPIGHAKFKDRPTQMPALSSDGKFLGVSAGRKLTLWDVDKQQRLWTHNSKTKLPNSQFAAVNQFSRDGKFWLAGSPLRLMNQKGRVLNIFNDSSLKVAALSPDGGFVALGYTGGTILIWDTKEKTYLPRITGPQRPVKSVQFSQDGQRLLASFSFDSSLIFRVQTQKVLATFKTHQPGIVARFLRGDSRVILDPEFGDGFELWNLGPKKRISVPKELKEPAYRDYSASGQRMLTYISDELSVWDLETLKLESSTHFPEADEPRFFRNQEQIYVPGPDRVTILPSLFQSDKRSLTAAVKP